MPSGVGGGQELGGLSSCRWALCPVTVDRSGTPGQFRFSVGVHPSCVTMVNSNSRGDGEASCVSHVFSLSQRYTQGD